MSRSTCRHCGFPKEDHAPGRVFVFATREEMNRRLCLGYAPKPLHEGAGL